MTYFLDTNICIYYLNGKFINLSKKIETVDINRIKIPAVVAAELYYGALKSAKQSYNVARYTEFLSVFEDSHCSGRNLIDQRYHTVDIAELELYVVQLAVFCLKFAVNLIKRQFSPDYFIFAVKSAVFAVIFAVV